MIYKKRNIKGIKSLMLLIGIILFFIPSLFPQSYIIWKKSYATANYKPSFRDMLINDTSLYLVGKANYINKSEDAELININKTTGNMTFQKHYGGSSYDYFSRLFFLNNSLFINGRTMSNENIFTISHGMHELFTLRTDLNGNLLNTNVYGGSQSEWGGSLNINRQDVNKFIWAAKSESNDGDLSSCPTNNNSAGRQWIFFSDTLGNITRSLCNDTILYGGNIFFQNNHYYYITSGKLTIDGGYTYPNNYGGVYHGWSGDIIIVKYDTAFNILSINNYGSDQNDVHKKVIRTNDNGFVILGTTYATNDTLDVIGLHKNNNGIAYPDIYCLKLDSNANLEWAKCYGSYREDSPNDIIQTSDGGYLFTGYIQEASGDVGYYYGGMNGDAWIVKLNASGNILWERTIGGTLADKIDLIREDIDGSIYIAGNTSSVNGSFSGLQQPGAFVMKLASWVGMESSSTNQNTIHIYPNPVKSNEFVNIYGLSNTNKDYLMKIYNLQGQEVFIKAFNVSNNYRFSLPQLAKGIYIIKVEDEDMFFSINKLIVN